MEKEWVKIQSYTDALRGEIIKQMLEENGIPVVLMNKQDSSFKFGKIDLMVNADDAEEARRLIAENESGETDEN
ncbi:putative signal transducing protein [Sphingobacterium wenxiniae]|uniref:Putative signal transducing protein n=1 Tax=Sphingobacterium wenxiniae TaxID=683125 RepID=A0A1I6SDQ6_9SPHI|nr:DUF2007 domain-containing protein [Sphingobacterium wenxiniae]SFS75105.1 Putative signal transducing protein [Sphingobacterium wenxiniae]